MANPQKEDGHVDIANEIAEHFALLNLSPYEWRILWVILRKTYGWNKKSDHISLSQFQKFTNIPSQHVARTISQLLDKNLIVKKNGSLVMEYGFQKDYDKWNILPTKVVPAQVVPTQVLPNKVLPAEALGTTSIGTPPETKGTTSTGSHNNHINNNITNNNIQVDVKTSPEIKELTYEETDNEGNLIKKKVKKPKKQPDPIILQKANELIEKLNQIRIPKPTSNFIVERVSANRMLRHYTPDQIIESWQKLKKDFRYQNREVYLMNVEKDISVLVGLNTNISDNPDKFTQGKYGNQVQT